MLYVQCNIRYTRIWLCIQCNIRYIYICYMYSVIYGIHINICYMYSILQWNIHYTVYILYSVHITVYVRVYCSVYYSILYTVYIYISICPSCNHGWEMTRGPVPGSYRLIARTHTTQTRAHIRNRLPQAHNNGRRRGGGRYTRVEMKAQDRKW